ncbi:phosphate ABC transporter permease subunit PstC [Roseospirillum parvum]|uniref:Phosphate transport system permease protein n=1 Tax=Roseospirillum parvum TaxID=83401 RepID=A0A1G7X0B6_9PROT|nr:phosphate ABC transporter permease subunit PstC [Roseospirillum parvum]SDG77625.1 phosphate transport system permease protein [Roseospirillum parvum]
MSLTTMLLVLLVAALAVYFLGSRRARQVVRGEIRQLHSLPPFYGAYVGLWLAVPALAVMILWLAIEPMILGASLRADLPASVLNGPKDQIGLIVSTIKSLATGGVTGSTIEPFMMELADDYAAAKATGRSLMTAAVFAAALAGGVVGFLHIRPAMRARNRVETVIRILLIVASSIAILTTAGIVLSMLFETINFFREVPLANFFLGTTWDPRFAAAGSGGATGQFGMLPLLWGTMFVSIVAMAVAVPVGLFAAIYMAEYAAPKVRSVVKPLLEILAGIPTVVYGFFALVTVGPFLRDIGGTIGLDIDARSTLTAGFVMGIMIIPFVSSLSDDVITAVPQAMREGSYGLGATRSETIRRVVFPAALPGIVGSILLAVSRAIGETMIVVMAAGVTANLTANPLEPITTVTVKIVNQLTGDHEFSSPQTLVAFALGMTLFVITLGLNIVALRVVRKYREQYE